MTDRKLMGIIAIGVLISIVCYATLSLEDFEGIGAFNQYAKAKLDANFAAIETEVKGLVVADGMDTSYTNIVLNASTNTVTNVYTLVNGCITAWTTNGVSI